MHAVRIETVKAGTLVKLHPHNSRRWVKGDCPAGESGRFLLTIYGKDLGLGREHTRKTGSIVHVVAA